MSTILKHKERVVSGDWLRHYSDREFAIESGVVVSGAGNLPSGSVVTEASGKLQLCAAADTPKGIIVDEVDATDGDAHVAVVVRDAIITKFHLNWAADVDTEAKKQALLDTLAANKIIVRGEA